MAPLWIRATPQPGCDIRDAARAAIELARRADVGVEFLFNGVLLRATPAATVEELFHDYRRGAAERESEADGG